jgi:hypothetical protein
MLNWQEEIIMKLKYTESHGSTSGVNRTEPDKKYPITNPQSDLPAPEFASDLKPKWHKKAKIKKNQNPDLTR